jgi:hypothetical protein
MLTTARSHRGGVVLGLGIAGMLTSLLLLPVAIGAWVLGAKELKAMESGASDPSGRTITQVGWVLGIVGTAIWGLMVLRLIAILLIDYDLSTKTTGAALF